MDNTKENARKYWEENNTKDLIEVMVGYAGEVNKPDREELRRFANMLYQHITEKTNTEIIDEYLNQK